MWKFFWFWADGCLCVSQASRRPRVARIFRALGDNRPTNQIREPSRWSPDIVIVRKVIFQGRCWEIDRDIININGTRLRLAGIDAPELDHPYGQIAKFALMRLCKGQVIRAVTEGDQSYDLLVATCYLPDGRDLSAEMVKAGQAID